MTAAANKICGIAGWVMLGGIAGAFAQDVMLQRLPFLKVVAEDEKVRVLRYAPGAGEKSAMHSFGRLLPISTRRSIRLRAFW
jgi:hypothetical protein